MISSSMWCLPAVVRQPYSSLPCAITLEPDEVMEGRRRIDGARDAEEGGRGGLGRERKAAERYRGREGEMKY